MARSVDHRTGAADQHGAPPPSGAFEGVIVAILVTAAGIAAAYMLDLSGGMRIVVMALAMAAGAACGAALTRRKRKIAAQKRATAEAERRHVAEQEYQRKLAEAKERGQV